MATLLLAASASGCGVVFGGTRQTLPVRSGPQGAAITSPPGTATFTTPASLILNRKSSYVPELSKEGYTTARVEITRKLRPFALAADISAGLVVTFFRGVLFEGVTLETPLTLGGPLLVDAVTSGLYRLQPRVVSVQLEKVGDVDGPQQIEVRLAPARGSESQGIGVGSTAPGVTGRLTRR